MASTNGKSIISNSIAAVSCLVVLVLAPAPVWAQHQAGIAGAVVDVTGGALPGVTVTAGSPALIEQTRTAVTDGTGNYQIIALPPGTYSVTFSLDGFNTMVREDVVLTGAFTAPVDATLPVGELSETVTVTGAAPLVDIVSTRQQSVLTAARIHVLPGAANTQGAAQYVPGVSTQTCCFGGPALHGSDVEDGQPYLDGLKAGKNLGGRNSYNGGIGQGTNEAAVAELIYDTSTLTAESAHSGVRANLIPKSGGNTFAFEVFATGTQERFQSNNLSPALEDQGFRFAPQAWNWSLNPAAGGPIIKDKLWFFTAYIGGQNKAYHLDILFDPDEPTTPEGLGDDLRAFQDGHSTQTQLRITHQLTQRNKLTYQYVSHNQVYRRALGTDFGRVQAEALFSGDNNPAYLLSTRWTSPMTNRLLFEVIAGYQRMTQNAGPQPGQETRVSFRDLVSGVQSNKSYVNLRDEGHRRDVNASVSYVTGSHNFKAGLNYANNIRYYSWPTSGDVFDAYTINGAPFALLVMASAAFKTPMQQNCDCGIFAQDAWTMDRLTLNLGLRYDWFNNSIPAGTRPGGFFAPERTFTAVEDTPNWTNWTGRLGAAFDLFGDGATAVKVSAGRYLRNEALGVTEPFNALSPFANLDFRLWTDLNGDGNPLNPDGTPQLDEIAASFNPNFGTPTLANQWDPNTPRGKNWEFSGGVERQLGPGWAISGMWHRRRYDTFRWVDNQVISASDYVPIQWTAPVDSRLPNGGGESITVHSPRVGADLSTGNLLTTLAPDNWRTWNGFEVIVDGELRRGGFMTASWTTGKSGNHFCQGGDDSPNRLRFCDNETPYRNIVKLSGAIPLPFDTMISGLFQMFPGGSVGANYTLTEADLGPGVINNQSGNIEVELIEPWTQFYDATTSLLLRFAKTITVGDVRTRVYMNANNIFNRAAVTRRNQFFGGAGVLGTEYQRPIEIQRGRQLSFGMQMFF